jgi:putative inorganic carbon (HCO3(-)) transporter
MRLVINWLEAALLAALAPLFVFPAVDRVWPFLVFPLLWVARWWVEERRKLGGEAGLRGGEMGVRGWAGTPLDAAIMVLALQLLVSSVAAGDCEAMLPKIAGILYGILVYFALVRLVTTDRLAGAGLGVFVAGGTALAALGLTGMFVSKEPNFREIVTFLFKKVPQRNWAFEGAEAGLNPNAVAGVMLLFVPLCLVLAFAWTKRRRPGREGAEETTVRGKAFAAPAGTAVAIVCGALSIFFLIVLFLTQTVASWVALVAGVWLVLPKGRARVIGAFPAALFFAAVLVFLPMTDKKATAQRGQPFWKQKIEARYPFWDVGIDAVREKPLTGVGVNLLRQRPELGYEHAHAHNLMLHTAAEMGIPGLIAYLAILGGAGYMCRETWRKASAVWMRAAARGLGAGQAAHFIFGWGDAIPLGAKPGIFFWVSLALIAALYERTRVNCGPSRGAE